MAERLSTEFTIGDCVEKDIQHFLNNFGSLKKDAPAHILVFPVGLGPVAMRNIRLQAAIYDLKAIYMGKDETKIVVVFRHTYLRQHYIENFHQYFLYEEDKEQVDLAYLDACITRTIRGQTRRSVRKHMRLSSRSNLKLNSEAEEQQLMLINYVELDKPRRTTETLIIPTEDVDAESNNIPYQRQTIDLGLPYDSRTVYLDKVMEDNGYENDVNHTASYSEQYTSYSPEENGFCELDNQVPEEVEVFNPIDCEEYMYGFKVNNPDYINFDSNGDIQQNSVCAAKDMASWEISPAQTIDSYGTAVSETEHQLEQIDENRISKDPETLLEIGNLKIRLNSMTKVLKIEKLTDLQQQFHLSPEAIDEIKEYFGEHTHIVCANQYYKPFQTRVYKNMDHIIEMYHIRPTVVTCQLLNVFKYEKCYIKWVNQTHALLVTSSPLRANRILQKTFRSMKLRAMKKASAASVVVACRCNLRPAKMKPVCIKQPNNVGSSDFKLQNSEEAPSDVNLSTTSFDDSSVSSIYQTMGELETENLLQVQEHGQGDGENIQENHTIEYCRPLSAEYVEDQNKDIPEYTTEIQEFDGYYSDNVQENYTSQFIDDIESNGESEISLGYGEVNYNEAPINNITYVEPHYQNDEFQYEPQYTATYVEPQYQDNIGSAELQYDPQAMQGYTPIYVAPQYQDDGEFQYDSQAMQGYTPLYVAPQYQRNGEFQYEPQTMQERITVPQSYGQEIVLEYNTHNLTNFYLEPSEYVYPIQPYMQDVNDPTNYYEGVQVEYTNVTNERELTAVTDVIHEAHQVLYSNISSEQNPPGSNDIVYVPEEVQCENIPSEINISCSSN